MDPTPPRGSQHEDRACGVPAQVELVEKSLPRGEGGQGQRRRTRVVQRARLRSDDAFVHELQPSVGAGTLQCSGVVDVIARLEESGLLTDRDDRSRCIPSQDAFLAAGVVEGGAHFDVNGVDGQCLNLHEDVVASGAAGAGTVASIRAFGVSTEPPDRVTTAVMVRWVSGLLEDIDSSLLMACARFDGSAPSTSTDRSQKKVVTRNDPYYQEDSGVPVRRP